MTHSNLIRLAYEVGAFPLLEQHEDIVLKLVKAAADHEREACASIADTYTGCLFVGTTAQAIAADIRARK